MDLTTPVLSILVKYTLANSSQLSTKGARPLKGKANTEFSRAESNSVSTPCENGDEADSAMKCGT